VPFVIVLILLDCRITVAQERVLHISHMSKHIRLMLYGCTKSLLASAIDGRGSWGWPLLRIRSRRSFPASAIDGNRVYANRPQRVDIKFCVYEPYKSFNEYHFVHYFVETLSQNNILQSKHLSTQSSSEPPCLQCQDYFLPLVIQISRGSRFGNFTKRSGPRLVA
jgi:hypothetical protein